MLKNFAKVIGKAFEKIVPLQKINFMPRKAKNIEPQVIIKQDTEGLKRVIVDALQEIKGHGITEIRFDGCVEQPLFDAFILCSATSTTQAEALCDNVMRCMKKCIWLPTILKEGIRRSGY